MRQLYSASSEESVIGAMLAFNGCIDDVADIVRPDYFYTPVMRAICTAIFDIRGNGKQVDIVTVEDWFNGKPESQFVTFDDLAKIISNCPSAVGVIGSAKRVADYAMEREFMICANSIQEVFGEEDGTTEERIAKAEQLFNSITTEQPAETQSDVAPIIKDYIDHLDWRFNNPGFHGVATGFEKIDERFNGWKGGQFIVEAGTPGAGKTTYAMNIAFNASQEKNVHVFSLEMSKRELMQRMIASAGGIPIKGLQDATALNNQEYCSKLTVAVSRIKACKLTIDDGGGIDISQMVSRCRRQHRKAKIDLIVVDYLQLLKDRSAGNRYEEVSSISRKLKQLAKELDCVVLALSQLNRKVMDRGDKRPVLSDLRESGQIEQDADIIQFLFREEIYNPDTPNKGICEVITAKFRDGETGSDYLKFEGAINRMSNIDWTPQPVESKPAYSYGK